MLGIAWYCIVLQCQRESLQLPPILPSTLQLVPPRQVSRLAGKIQTFFGRFSRVVINAQIGWLRTTPWFDDRSKPFFASIFPLTALQLIPTFVHNFTGFLTEKSASGGRSVFSLFRWGNNVSSKSHWCLRGVWTIQSVLALMEGLINNPKNVFSKSVFLATTKWNNSVTRVFSKLSFSER